MKADCRLEWCDGKIHEPDIICKSKLGGWHCVTCHSGFENNLMVRTHVEANTDHEIGWSCGKHLVIETP